MHIIKLFCKVSLSTLLAVLILKDIFQFDRKQWYFPIVLICISSITEENQNLTMCTNHLFFSLRANYLCMTSMCFNFVGALIYLGDLYQGFDVVPTLVLMLRFSVDNPGDFMFSLLRV